MCDEQQQERPREIPVKFSIWDPVLREKGHAGQPAATVAALEVCPAADDTAFGCVEGLRVPGNLMGLSRILNLNRIFTRQIQGRDYNLFFGNETNR